MLEYGDCRFTLNFNRKPMSIDAVLRLDYRVTFDQENVDFLNSITNYWSNIGLLLTSSQKMRKI